MSRKNPPAPRPDPAPFDDETTEIGEGLGDGLFDAEGLPPEDLEGLEDFPEDEDEKTIPGYPLGGDLFEDSRVESAVVLDPRSTTQGRYSAVRAAPEVSQGPWRERAFIPRGVVPKEQILEGIEQALQIAAIQKGSLDRVRIALRAELMPNLRQAVEQAGGDGLDGWLSRLLDPPGKAARDPLLQTLAAQMGRFGRADTSEALLAEVRALAQTVKKALFNPAAKKLSLEQLEDELEGRLEVDTLLGILFALDPELEKQREQVARTLESLRMQLRGLPGSSPEGLMWNFTRLKVEQKVIEAEQKRRTALRG